MADLDRRIIGIGLDALLQARPADWPAGQRRRLFDLAQEYPDARGGAERRPASEDEDRRAWATAADEGV